MKAKARAQALIIGSGSGGAVTALELARGGMGVLVLEEGGRYGLEDYGYPAPEAMKKLYRRKGMTPILGSASIGFVEGCCVGGSTEINSGFWQRPMPEVLLGWKSRYDLIDASAEQLEPHFEMIEKVLHVGLSQKDWPPSTKVFAKGVEKMGWSFAEAPRAAHNCKSTNACPSGCPRGAKQGMSRTFIPLAEAAGAKIKPNCAVRRLIRNGSRIAGVLAEQTNDDGSKNIVRIDADYVFVCAGAVQTPALLRQSGIKRNIGNTLSIHPMLKVVARYKEELNAEQSVLPLVQVKEFQPDAILAGSYYSLGHLALLLSDNWPSNREDMKWHRYMAAYFAAVRGTGKGFVRPSFLDRSALARYKLSKNDLAGLSRGLARLCTLLLAGGAEEVYPCVFGLPSIKTQTQAMRWLNETLPKRAISLTTVHAFSTCPMGERRELCAVDSFGKVFGFENLYINDASMLPSSPGATPQAIIMALARRNAVHFKERRK